MNDSFFYGPIIGMTVHRRSIKVHRKCPAPWWGNKPPERGVIKYLSQSSLSRLAFTAVNHNLPLKSILTLTYSEHYTKTGLEVKRSLNRYLTGFRRLCNSPSYLWFLEFQRRAAPHVHILASVDPSTSRRVLMADAWVKATKTEGRDAAKMFRVHSHPRSWELIRDPDGAAKYALKYATKPEQKVVPDDFQDVGRFWGCSRDISRSAAEVFDKIDCGEYDVRWYAAIRGRDMSTYPELPGNIWVDPLAEIDNRDVNM